MRGRWQGVPAVGVPAVALRDARLYELLALVDAICDGRARERNLAAKQLESRLDGVTA